MATSRAMLGTASRQLLWNKMALLSALPSFLFEQRSLSFSAFRRTSCSGPQSEQKTAKQEMRAEEPKQGARAKEAVRFGGGPVSAADVADWTPIYRFHYIVLARAIQRLKLYQTGFTCFVLLPLAQLSEQTDMASAALGVSVLACTMLCIMGSFSARIVGIVYVHKEDPTRLRLARLSFFGARVDMELPADAFVPITDSSCNPADAYVELLPVHRPALLTPWQQLLPILFQDKYYLSLRFGTVLEPQSFIRLFGDVSAYLRPNKDKS